MKQERVDFADSGQHARSPKEEADSLALRLEEGDMAVLRQLNRGGLSTVRVFISHSRDHFADRLALSSFHQSFPLVSSSDKARRTSVLAMRL